MLPISSKNSIPKVDLNDVIERRLENMEQTLGGLVNTVEEMRGMLTGLVN